MNYVTLAISEIAGATAVIQRRFTTLALANMLSELRKYRIRFTIAHQYLQQLSPEIRHSILGNIGTIISFRVGVEDECVIPSEGISG
jgi:hypothetical protein